MGIRQIMRAGQLLKLSEVARFVEARLVSPSPSALRAAREAAFGAWAWVQAQERACPSVPRATLLCGCGYRFDAACGRYGCPNCEGENADGPRLL